ncbi:FAD-dependent pyridine nucleotide-disulfide oxidoreductase [uncultured Mycobacterium sp.]|uniref:FAD-dependent pyridine nucleotide-disulfide oxidoreductase n=1 Tax=uncultured Mycobacterium sp. TaxID=171292 RepID=A0A1Y5NZT4_9MYCO|nr:FAD-dependent pyridine nucleotide-disulfide oxidoreductase [uncultured Mycobacterium sp.]
MTVDVAIVGGGPAGLTAAAALGGRYKVVVLERESAAGGIPRHSDHLGYGIRDLRTVLSGPHYARRLVAQALSAGVDVRTEAMVTDWAGERALEVTSPRGREVIEARAVVLATGARERPRPARLIAGERPAGIYTTGHLQNLVHVHGRGVGRRAVVVGAELVSYSAVLTLRHAGCRTVLMTSEHQRPESYQAFTVAARAGLGVRVATRTRVTRIIGTPALRAVEIENTATGARRIIDCDTLILTGDWIPDHELARSAGLEVDPIGGVPLVDTALRTNRTGVFAIGNLVHPVDTADVAALDGRHVAAQIQAYLAGHRQPRGGVRLLAEAPLRWISPGLLRPGDGGPPRNRLLAWTDTLLRSPVVTAHQDGTLLASRRLPWPASPGRIFRIPARIVAGAARDGGPVTVTVR